MAANNDLKTTDSVSSDNTGTLITGRIGGGKNFGLLELAVAAQTMFANRPGSDLSYMVLSNAATESISDRESAVK